jgi:Mrp family chromosome partitioning ATPase
VILALLGVTTIRWWRADPEPPRLEDAQSALALLGVPVVGEIPYLRRPTGSPGIVTSRYPDVADAYRMVAAATPVRGSVLLSAAGTDESCSDLALNCGAVLSRDGYRVLLVEGDPQIGRLIGQRANQGPGLTDMVIGHADLSDCMLSGSVGDKTRMGLVPWGTGPTGLPRSAQSQLGETITQLAVYADMVLIDGPPLASSADGLALAGHVDSILLVVSTGTSVSDIRRLRARLDQLDRPVLGVVVQHTSSRRRSRRVRGATTLPVRWASARPTSATEPTKTNT